MKCFSCGNTVEITTQPGRADCCPKCQSDLKVCLSLNCVFHDTSSYNECREPQAERITEKDRANFCDYFKVGGTNKQMNNSGSIDELKELFKEG